MDMRDDDAAWLEQAIELALNNVTEGGRPFGALVVRDGAVLGTGVNRALQDNDPTAHAELLAIRAAAARVGSPVLRGATVVASGSPCPMCQAAAMHAQVSRIVYAADAQEAVAAGLAAGGIEEDLARPFAQRTIVPIDHVPVESAREPFAAWTQRSAGEPAR
jgi:tRNA(Arg) A34 adenosine deaminase TadA